MRHDATRNFPARRALLLGVAAVLALARLGHAPLVSEEYRWGEVARGMARSGDPFTPSINGRLYYDKPLGSYWPIVLVARLSGGVDEFAARLPSALSALVAVAVVIDWGRRRFSDSAGLWAGAVLASSWGFAFYARRASADLENLLGILLAAWLYDRAQGRWTSRRVLALWLTMAASSLMKGLLGFAVPIFAFGLHAAWAAWADTPTRSARALAARFVAGSRWLFHPAALLAIPLAVGLYALPFALSPRASEGLAMVVRENLTRFVAPHNHRGPVHLYFGVVVALAAPWSLLLPFVARDIWRAQGVEPSRRFVGVWFAATFAFFTLSASRRSYYLLPILPPLALLVGEWLARRRVRPAWGAAVLLGLVAWFALAQPRLDDERPRRAFARAVVAAVGDSGGLVLHPSAELSFELDAPDPVPEVASPAELPPGARWLVVPRKLAGPFLELGAVEAEEEMKPWEDAGRAGNKLLLVRLRRG